MSNVANDVPPRPRSGRISDFITWAKKAKEAKIIAEIREWLKRRQVVEVRVFVRNRVSNEQWRVDFGTLEEAHEYISELARSAPFGRYTVWEVMPGMYDVGPYRVDVVIVRVDVRGGEWA